MRENGINLNQQYFDELLPIIGIGTWDWNLLTNEVIYSTAWGAILGYTIDELPQVVDTWERMVLPADLGYANKKIEGYLEGITPNYEAEFRMVCKDGSIIWAQDKGKVIEYDNQGKPKRFVGVLQNVTRLKDTELRLRENQTTLDLAVSVAGLGTWDWDIPGDYIKYNDEYLQMLGYQQSDMKGSIDEWETLNHPYDLTKSLQLLQAYMANEIPAYECEIRMRHKDGHYVWTRDVGQIVARDTKGNPTRIIGGHLNIDALKRSQERLKEALEELEHGKLYLESEVDNRTKELVEHDKMLETVNQVSRILLTFQHQDDFEAMVQDCLRLLGESINKSRVYIWKDKAGKDGQVYCTQIYEWVRDVAPIQGQEEYEEISYKYLPFFEKAIDSNQCLNSKISQLSEYERTILEPQGIKAILIAPVAMNGKRWGFIGVDNCENETLFSSIEENMLFMSGSMLASTIEKMDREAQMREMEERSQIMLNAMPLCCNLWTQELHNMRCNDEAVRLFETSSQEEYLTRFEELSPEYQPGGELSSELSKAYLRKAFKEGYCRFEWLHQKLDGTPIPTEITLVRIKYKNSFIVTGYTRDLRKQKAMLSQLLAKEDDLRNARDEALLSSKAKSNFLANMSHEIRTPMNAISGLAEIILRENKEGKSGDYARSIKNACNNLLNIINDILDISKIESGKLEIVPGKYELASLLNDVITIARMRLGSKSLMFTTNLDANLPSQLLGDEIRIKQILINILSNAIKFTDKGYISFRVSAVEENGYATLRFTVTDTGTGIPAEDIERLFAQFERVNTTKNRSIEGTGLGLAISKQLCEMMGGRIEVQSKFGEGSVFTAVIPQEYASREPLSKVQNNKNILLYEPRELYRESIAESIENLGCTCVPCSNQSELYDNLQFMEYDYIITPSLYLAKVQLLVKRYQLPAQIAVTADYEEQLGDERVYKLLIPVSVLQLEELMNGYRGGGNYSRYTGTMETFIAPTARILVVDDNPVNLSVAEGLMEPYQFFIDTAINGIDAVQMVQKNSYDLVFMDHMMPEMDGIDATIAIRQLKGEYYKKLPIVALTANALVGTKEMFIREGMNDFLAKPIEINKLTNILLKWIPESKIVKQLPEDLIEKENRITLPNILGVDTNQGLLTLGGDYNNYMRILSVYYADGKKKCSSLYEHVAEQNLVAFRTEVHGLKSASASVGALVLSQMAQQLENAAQEGNILYVEQNIEELITNLKEILNAVEVFVDKSTISDEQQVQNENKPEGNKIQLGEWVMNLQEEAELANIEQMENVMNKMKSYTWQQEVADELSLIEEFITVFDYDSVLECANKIKKIL